jgi:signal transduction histidine kinase
MPAPVNSAAILAINNDISGQKAAEAQRAAARQAVLQQSQRLELLHEIDRSTLAARLLAEIETCAYRVVQEALANAGQHARATHVAIALTRGAGKLHLQVRDDGVGFDVREAEARGSVGLVAMRERAEAVRGALSLASVRGSGTTVTLEIPETSAVPQS